MEQEKAASALSLEESDGLVEGKRMQSKEPG